MIIYANLCWQMTNVSRHWSNAAHTELVYYLVQHYSQFVTVNESLPIATSEDTCLMLQTLDRQRIAIILGYVIVTLCQR